MHWNSTWLKNLASAGLFAYLLIGLGGGAQAGVMQVGSEYAVSYSMSLNSGTPTGGDIQNVVIFEWDEGTNKSVDWSYSIAAIGRTDLTHTISFAPTSAIILGFLEPGEETANKRLLYTLFSVEYSDYITENLVGVLYGIPSIRTSSTRLNWIKDTWRHLAIY